MPSAEVQQIGSRVFNLITAALDEKHGISAERFNELQQFIGKRDRIALGDNVFKLGEAWAGDDRFTVFDYFEALDKVPGIEGDIRVYLLGPGGACMRIALNAVAARRHLFDEQTFAQLIAAEWAAVDEVLSEEDDDGETTVKCASCGAENWELLPIGDEAEEDAEQEESRHCGSCGATLVQVVPQ